MDPVIIWMVQLPVAITKAVLAYLTSFILIHKLQKELTLS